MADGQKQQNYEESSNNGNDNVPDIENQSAGAVDEHDFQVIETFDLNQ